MHKMEMVVHMLRDLPWKTVSLCTSTNTSLGTTRAPPRLPLRTNSSLPISSLDRVVSKEVPREAGVELVMNELVFEVAEVQVQ